MSVALGWPIRNIIRTVLLDVRLTRALCSVLGSIISDSL